MTAFFEQIWTHMAVMGLVAIMFSMGLGITLEDFRRIVTRPYPVALGLFGQILILPVVAFAIVYVLQLPEPLALGLIIVAACPGGATSNAFSYMSHGDVPLSITLTAVSGALAFITTPLVVNLGVSAFAETSSEFSLPFAKTSIQVLTTTALPVALGMLSRTYIPLAWNRLKNVIFAIGLKLIIVPSLHTVTKNFDVMLSMLGDAAIAAIGLNIAMLLVGWLIAALGRLSLQQQKTISLEVGLQNFGLAVVIITSFLKRPELLIVGLFYLQSMLTTGALFVGASRWNGRKNAA